MSKQIKRVTKTLEKIPNTAGFTLGMAKEAFAKAKQEFLKYAESTTESKNQAF